MKVWPIDPLVPRNLRLEVPEKLPQGLMYRLSLSLILNQLESVSGYAPGSVNVSRDNTEAIDFPINA